MKRYIYLFALCALALVGCEDNTKQTNTNNDKEENTIPYWWSPAGHTYASEGSTREYSWVADVLYFYTKDSVVMYSTLDKDYSIDNAMHPEYGTYRYKYPNGLIITIGIDEGIYVISDTSTICWNTFEKTYKLIN